MATVQYQLSSKRPVPTLHSRSVLTPLRPTPYAVTIRSRARTRTAPPGIVGVNDKEQGPERHWRPTGHDRGVVDTPVTDAPPPDGDLPNFDAPPVVEVALGAQFRPLFGLRPIELAGLREQWRAEYPLVQEQPPVPPTVETATSGAPTVQFVVGPALQSRVWFLNDDQSELVQLQHDRLTVNWRQTTSSAYPRYPRVRTLFEQRFTDLATFVADRNLGTVTVTQVEVTYINAIDATEDQLGSLDRVLRHWQPPTMHLGSPEQARSTLVFPVPDVGSSPVRMYVAVDPAKRPDGRPVLFLTLTVRGAPTGDDAAEALRFMDQAHAHVVRGFAELTPDAMHAQWGRRR